MKFILLLILTIIFSYSISNDNKEPELWRFFRLKAGLTEEAAAAFMGNLYSGLKSDIYNIADHPNLDLADYMAQIRSG